MTLTYHRWLKQTTKIKRGKKITSPHCYWITLLCISLAPHSVCTLVATAFLALMPQGTLNQLEAYQMPFLVLAFLRFFFCLLYHNMTEMNKMDWRCFDRCLTNPSSLSCLLRILEIASSSLKLHSVLAAHGSHERYPMQGCFQFRWLPREASVASTRVSDFDPSVFEAAVLPSPHLPPPCCPVARRSLWGHSGQCGL